MAFDKETIEKAWNRQGGVCVHSGKRLVKGKRGENTTGGWEAHHRNPTVDEGSDTLRNCVLFSVYPTNYHFEIGHGGISWSNYEPLNASEIPYVSYGNKVIKTRTAARKPRKTRRQSRKSINPGIIRLR